jgi:acetoacetyl-CoA synthetase
LRKLRILTSTGAVLSTDLFEWFYETAFPPTAHLISMSGGTDIAGSCKSYPSNLRYSTNLKILSVVGGTPLLAVYAGEIQAKVLGMAVEIFDAAAALGISVERSGESGELVCTKPFPSQPIQFFGTDGEERYRNAYFERFGKKVWCQGDFARLEKDTNGLILLGRS